MMNQYSTECMWCQEKQSWQTDGQMTDKVIHMWSFALLAPQKSKYSDDSFIRTRLFPVDISGLTSFQDYRIAH